MTWQPIETAPKDGTDVLLVWVDSDAMIVAAWDCDTPHDSWRWHTLDGQDYHTEAFRAWMPLPEPPK